MKPALTGRNTTLLLSATIVSWLPSLASCITRTCGSCAAMSSGVDVPTGGWDIRGRWFGVVVGATPRQDDPMARDRRPDRTARRRGSR